MGYKAPDGTAIRGIAQEDAGTWPVYWEETERGETLVQPESFAYTDDGPSSEWQSVDLDGFIVFDDENGGEWLPHHLIKSDAERLSKLAIEAARNEVLARRQAKAAAALVALLPPVARPDVERLATQLRGSIKHWRREFRSLRGDG